VLIGTQTAFRPWVRYELVRSFYRGNGLLGVYVDGIKNFAQVAASRGPNPFDHLAYRVSDDRIYWQELGSAWGAYESVPSMAQRDTPYLLNGQLHHTFSCLFPVYDWFNDRGYENLGSWIDKAAQQARK
jgi:hypothetical protein